jgi:hypothetical protein
MVSIAGTKFGFTNDDYQDSSVMPPNMEDEEKPVTMVENVVKGMVVGDSSADPVPNELVAVEPETKPTDANLTPVDTETMPTNVVEPNEVVTDTETTQTETKPTDTKSTPVDVSSVPVDPATSNTAVKPDQSKGRRYWRQWDVRFIPIGDCGSTNCEACTSKRNAADKTTSESKADENPDTTKQDNSSIEELVRLGMDKSEAETLSREMPELFELLSYKRTVKESTKPNIQFDEKDEEVVVITLPLFRSSMKMCRAQSTKEASSEFNALVKSGIKIMDEQEDPCDWMDPYIDSDLISDLIKMRIDSDKPPRPIASLSVTKDTYFAMSPYGSCYGPTLIKYFHQWLTKNFGEDVSWKRVVVFNDDLTGFTVYV